MTPEDRAGRPLQAAIYDCLVDRIDSEYFDVTPEAILAYVMSDRGETFIFQCTDEIESRIAS